MAVEKSVARLNSGNARLCVCAGGDLLQSNLVARANQLMDLQSDAAIEQFVPWFHRPLKNSHVVGPVED